jgi:hypothetical protein
VTRRFRRSTAPTQPLPILGMVALAVLVLALIFAAVQIPPVLRAMNLSEQPAPKPTDPRKDLDAFASAMDLHVRRVDGRSMFIDPAPPAPPEERREPERRATVYAGPSLLAAINGVAWFSDGTRLREGESSGPLKLLALNVPWSARVEWEGGEFTVDLFARNTIVPLTDPSSTAPAENDADTEQP